MENDREIDEEGIVQEGLRTLIREILKQIPQEMSESEKATFEELFFKILAGGASPTEALGISPEMLEHMYAYGYRLYNNGSYKRANEIFTALAIFQPDEAKYYLGQGACLQRLDEWLKAAAAYNTCSLLDLESPLPLFYLYECLSQLKLYKEAAQALQAAILRCGDEELLASIKERCQLLLQTIPEKEAVTG